MISREWNERALNSGQEIVRLPNRFIRVPPAETWYFAVRMVDLLAVPGE